MIEEIKTELDNIIQAYGEEYHPKILDYLKRELPERLEQQIKRTERLKILQKDATQFVNEFTTDSDIKYMYIQKSNQFVKYDGENYSTINESILLHKILSNLSNKRELMQWKYKIKNNIIKNIKETSVFDLIPESNTIQKVLNGFIKMLFNTKLETRYFLTLLGDNILKKNQNLIHLISPQIKPLITVMEDYTYNYFQGKYHINTTFKYSWHDHAYINCRCLNIKPIADLQKLKNFIKHNILNIVAVSVHYSKRYETSDAVLKRARTDKNVVNTILYTVNETEDTFVAKFINDMLQSTSCFTVITFKEIMYLWKIFLKNNNIPNLIFSNTLKLKLQNKYEYNETNDNFTGITSGLLKKTKTLCDFWNNFIEVDKTEIMEISDLCDVYNDWLTSEDGDGLNECEMISILKHFYDIDHKNNIIGGIKCSLWDKKGEINTVLIDIKEYNKFSPDNEGVSIESVYNDYSKLCDQKFNYRIVGKQCFKKYIIQLIPNKYIIKNRISKDYWLS
jgi:hypothetical protein